MKQKAELRYALDFASREADAATGDEKKFLADQSQLLRDEVDTLEPNDARFEEVAGRVASFVTQSKQLFREALGRQFGREQASLSAADALRKGDWTWYERNPYMVEEIFKGERIGTVRLRSIDDSFVVVRTTSLSPIDHTDAAQMSSLAEFMQRDMALRRAIRDMFTSESSIEQAISEALSSGTHGLDFAKRMNVLVEMGCETPDVKVLKAVAARMFEGKAKLMPKLTKKVRSNPTEKMAEALQSLSAPYVDDAYGDLFRQLKN